MKRLILLLAFCIFGLSASAQFWRLKRKPLPEIFPVKMQLVVNAARILSPAKVVRFDLEPSEYMIGFEEAAMIKTAKHHMRFREYVDASYNFSDLADMYVRQHRFSEAKWYLLQSNTIARNTENNRHLISNLLILADIKSVIGETALALTDLQEARTIAVSKDIKVDVPAIDKKIKFLQNNKITFPKAELRYANAVEIANAAKAAPVN